MSGYNRANTGGSLQNIPCSVRTDQDPSPRSSARDCSYSRFMWRDPDIEAAASHCTHAASAASTACTTRPWAMPSRGIPCRRRLLQSSSFFWLDWLSAGIPGSTRTTAMSPCCAWFLSGLGPTHATTHDEGFTQVGYGPAAGFVKLLNRASWTQQRLHTELPLPGKQWGLIKSN